MRDEDDAFQLVRLHQEIELSAGDVEQLGILRVSGQPGRAAGDRPAVVARDLQVPVAELVKRLAPTAVAARTN